MQDIRKVAVLGAGTMGSGIAAHCASAGVPVVLLDVTRDGESLARRALAALATRRPPPLMHPDDARRIEVGTVEADLGRVAEADWIVEAVVERLDVKRDLYARIEALRRPGSLVSSNTSTIPLRDLVAGLPERFAADFCITHFFNPVRYMRLLELVRGPATRPEVTAVLERFCDVVLGKGVVPCRDTPGFLANRIGVYALQVGVLAALEAGIDVEDADALLGRPAGIPKTGVFGLYDLIGIDLMLDVVRSLERTLPGGDPFHALGGERALLEGMVAAGRTGDKGGAGFYRTVREGGERRREALDLATGRYRPARRSGLAAAAAGEREGLRALVTHPDRHGAYAWRVLSRVLVYAASLIPEVADDPVPIDEAMKLGYAWRDGPFEMIDALGLPWFRERIAADGLPVPPILAAADGPLYGVEAGRIHTLGADGRRRPLERPPGVLRLADVARIRPPVLANPAASLWDLGDGVACVEWHSKANALEPRSMALLHEAVERVAAEFRGLVVYNEGPQHSVGVNIAQLLEAARAGRFADIEGLLLEFQVACRALKHAPFPAVGAPAGLAVGGGYEVLAHCDALQVHANAVLGLVEPQVGLIPGGGGCKEMLHRHLDATPDSAEAAARTFELIAGATTAGSPREARSLYLLLGRDQATMSRERLLAEAKARVLGLSEGYAAPAPRAVPAAGIEGQARIAAELERGRAEGRLTDHDLVVGRALARVLCGGEVPAGTPVAEDALYALERESFDILVRTPATQARIEHMLATGRALRN